MIDKASSTQHDYILHMKTARMKHDKESEEEDKQNIANMERSKVGMKLRSPKS